MRNDLTRRRGAWAPKGMPEVSLGVRACKCVCVCLCTYMYMCVYVYVHLPLHVYIHIYICVYVCICMRACTRTYKLHRHSGRHGHSETTQKCTYTHTREHYVALPGLLSRRFECCLFCMSVFMYVCMYAMHVLNVRLHGWMNG